MSSSVLPTSRQASRCAMCAHRSTADSSRLVIYSFLFFPVLCAERWRGGTEIYRPHGNAGATFDAHSLCSAAAAIGGGGRGEVSNCTRTPKNTISFSASRFPACRRNWYRNIHRVDIGILLYQVLFSLSKSSELIKRSTLDLTLAALLTRSPPLSLISSLSRRETRSLSRSPSANSLLIYTSY